MTIEFIHGLKLLPVQSVKKERTYELNSKFDKTYKFFSKSYHNMISEEIHC